MNIGGRIKQARLARKPKITQQQLAAAVGVSQPAVAQWENGDTRSLQGENLIRVARTLGVTIDWLQYGIEVGSGRSIPPIEANPVANDSESQLSRRAFLLAQVFDQLTPDQQDALQVLVDSITQPKAYGTEIIRKVG